MLRIPRIHLPARTPPHTRPRALPALALALALLVLPVATQRAGAFGVPLQTGISADPSGPEMNQALTHARALGSQFQRLTFSWRAIAPATPPPGFDAANPNDPAYNWGEVDRVIAATLAHGLTPYIGINEPPTWAQSPPGSGEESPDPGQLAQFTQAFATRYSGSQPGLPWIRYWEIWNEPNASYFLLPQLQAGRVVSVENYRAMLDDASAAIHAANPEDVVIGGALFPNGVANSSVTAIAPLEFMRELLCLSPGPRPQRTCTTQVNVDAISVHPYTSGGPSTLPANPNNVWIANLGSLTSLVKSAQSLGTLVSTHPAQTWVTEFGWGSTPPAPAGVPLALEQRWVAETLYRAWSAGVSQFSWYALRDEALQAPNAYGGLYFECPQGISCDTPKPAAAAFRFPFVVYPFAKHRVLVWGRTPAGARGSVQIQWLRGHRWRTLVKLQTDGDGIFTAHPLLPRKAGAKNALLRAVQAGAGASPSFSLRRTPDILIKPFGN
jgi:Cellulase (glycosyl hydrolase family 5)